MAVDGWLKNDFLKPAEDETDPTLKQLKMDEYKKTKVSVKITSLRVSS